MTLIKPSIKHPDTPSGGDEPDVWAIFRAVRDSGSVFGLRPGHMQTLQAMLSFLRPGHGETVFAGNAEICRRAGGIDERTLRRHIDRFHELGFLTRNDSPNGKRYRVRSSDGQAISFGLSLAPLLARANELFALVQQHENRRRDCVFLRKQILTRLARLEELDPETPLPSQTRKSLRRKLSISEYRALLATADAELRQMSTAVDMALTAGLPANDGQNDRHHSRSEKEDKDIEKAGISETPQVRTLVTVCKQATSYASNILRTWKDAEDHARTLAPMMGIQTATFEKATKAIGAEKATCAIFIMLQLGNGIRNFGAYFHSITLGRQVSRFNPSRLLARFESSDLPA